MATRYRSSVKRVLIRSTESPGESEKVNYAPITLFPSSVPRNSLEQLTSLQLHFNKMMHMVSQDLEFLQTCLRNLNKVDNFNKRLWDIAQLVTKEGITQPVSLGMFRNDYMMDMKHVTPDDPDVDPKKSTSAPECVQMKQVEFNTIATGSAGLISNVDKVHRYSLTMAGKQFTDSQIPVNKPAYGMAMGLVEAWKVYGNKSACVLFVVMEPELNTLDQRRLDLEIFQCDKSVPLKYVTFKRITESGNLRAGDQALLIDGCEVAVVYYRTGYSPKHYCSEKYWDTRLMMERSKAIKCPSVQCQLAGTKKVQQELCRPGAVERFIDDPEVAHQIRETFVNQFSLDLDEEGDEAVNAVFTNPQNYVLKSSREGGGNNKYGADIKSLLSGIKDSEERAKYILMERITPWPQSTYLVKSGHEVSLKHVVTEIGIFGVYLGTKDMELYNSVPGHVLRTKTADSDEGGLMVGQSYLDSPFHID
ncbi:glutathione synthetase-like [Argopecten irradians]|uniref:glutathione synthetase-like n=1 Tax=Argopecten irradians TaxID=31199 RepID=UPI003721F533